MRRVDVEDHVYMRLRELVQLEARNRNAPPPRFPDQAASELIGDLVEERLQFARTLGVAIRAIRR